MTVPEEQRSLELENQDLKRRLVYWENRAKDESEASEYYREQLAQAHELLGRVVHQTSERWDCVNLTRHFPTDNLSRKRSVSNPSGKSEEAT